MEYVVLVTFGDTAIARQRTDFKPTVVGFSPFYCPMKSDSIFPKGAQIIGTFPLQDVKLPHTGGPRAIQAWLVSQVHDCIKKERY